MFAAFFVIVIDLVGFGIMVPIFAFYALNLGASPALATLMMGLYSVAMFFTTPILGRVSDYYGRRPVLMVSMLGATIGYLILANASALWMVALARLISGAMAGNMAAAQAYMTDVSGEKDRAKAMGLIGAAFGIGFILGPALGSYLAGDDFENANFVLPAYVSAGLSFTAFLAVVFALPESLDRAHRDALRAKPRVSRFKEMAEVLKRPLARKVIVSGFIYNIAAGFFEAVFPIWASYEGARLVDGPQGLVPFLLVGGITLAVVQGSLVGPLTRRFGEHQLIKGGALGYGAGLIGMTLAADIQQVWLVYVFMGVASAASAVVMTGTQSLISQRAGTTERGMVMGVFNSMGTLGRSIGTLLTGAVFTYIYMHASFYVCAILMVVLFILAGSIQQQWRSVPV
ncbi:MFS transporter [Oceanicoccus sp. KOV_DT_Chl]|uniref:MFS transporter n=1 Tax=Oceanicoccus sp. KOV_DT_Chl TaxID=1904639 RepID=UPI000C7BCA4E|nr:MFS transporter [Oceanicoccus sp. KOV_DT_Chl]